MKFTFYKYQGTGNDFVIIDNRETNLALTEQNINTLCDRRFGIGADGLMLLEEDSDYDFGMKYFNSDGKESTMCGNGGRCMVSFAKLLGIINKETKFKAVDGVHKATIHDDETISLEMQDVSDIAKVNNNYYLNTGSPHYVLFRDDIDKIDVLNRGREIRYSGEFKPEGTNVNFVEAKNDVLYVRTYERGVENETLSCGTGVTASAISASIHTETDKSSYKIITKGGNLHVSFKKIDNNSFVNIWLTGPATFVFKGEITL